MTDPLNKQHTWLSKERHPFLLFDVKTKYVGGVKAMRSDGVLYAIATQATPEEHERPERIEEIYAEAEKTLDQFLSCDCTMERPCERHRQSTS
jgi:hypothetical protein